MKLYHKISALAMAALVVTTGFTSCSEDDLDTNQYNKSGVNILGFGPMPITRGETMRLTGTKLDKVREVLFPEGNQKLTPATTFIKGDFTVQNSEEMTVTIPDLCVPGKLRVVTESGDTIKSASSITFAEEVKVASFSPTSIHPGDILTIKGEYVWNIGQVVFFDHVTVDAEDFVRNTRNEIQVRVPMEAKSGEVAYNDGSDGAENTVIGNLSVDAAKATGVSNANPEFNETITITGENLDLVTAIDFPAVADVSFTIINSSSIRVVVPANAVSGTVTLHAASGLTTSVEIAVPLASVSSTDPMDDVKVGQTITITGDKLDRITKLLLPGISEPLEKGQFTQSATQITFVVPKDMGDGRVTLVQHENWSVESGKITMHSDLPEQAIWSGQFVCSGWNGNQDLAWGGFDWTTIEPDTKVMFYYKKNNPGQWGCISLRHGKDWGGLPSPIPGQFDLDEDEGVLSVTFPKNVLDDIIANNGLVITGDNYTLTKVAVPLPVTEVTIWKGNEDLSDGRQPYIGSDGGAEFIANNVHAGQVVKFYITIGDGWWFQAFEGHWAGMYAEWNGDNPDAVAQVAAEGCVKLKLTQAMIDAALTPGGWGGIFVVQGSVTLTKVTVADV
jgi:hypothetical protein